MKDIGQIIHQFDIPIKEILIERELINKSSFLISNLGFKNSKKLLITDENLYKIAKQILDKIDGRILILENPKPDEANIDKIISQAKEFDLIIAVGSGTINDLCKISSFRLKIPYIIFGTATSMNGYASANASIITSTYKTSLPAQLPQAIYLDLEILKNAPQRLIKSGIGDSLCFSTCQFDWLLSHFLLDTYYDQTPFDLLKPYQFLNNSDDLINKLAKNLIISGLGMYICKGSYPASQAEHLIAHYIEIKYPEIASKSYHGEQIAITTLTIAQIQETILKTIKPQITTHKADEKYLVNLFGKNLSKHFLKVVKKKEISKKEQKLINLKLEENWPEIKNELEKTFVSKDNLLKFHNEFSLSRKPQDININDKIYLEALNNAYLIRDRFTSLDLIKILK